MQDTLHTGETVARDLATRIRAGDRLAETELWQRYSRSLVLMILKRTRDRAQAEDVVQDCFRIALGHLRSGRLEQPGALPAFLRGIALNVLSTEFRDRQRERVTDPQGELMAMRVDESPGPYEIHSEHERRTLARRLMEQLPMARDRELLNRYLVGGQDKAEICRALALEPGQFDRVLHRAKERFRELFNRHGSGA